MTPLCVIKPRRLSAGTWYATEYPQQSPDQILILQAEHRHQMSRMFVRTPPLLSVIRFIKSIARLLRALFARHPDWMCLLGRPRLLRHRRRRLQASLQCRFRGLSVRPLLALNRCAFNFDCLQIRLSYRTHRFRYCVIINICLLC